MKIFKILFVALVAMIGFNSCSDDCDHNFIEHDFTQDIVGTWTYLAEGGLAEAMVIKADGSFTTTGIMKGGYLYEEKGTIKVVNNKVTLAFDGDNEAYEGRLELVAGKSLSIVMFNDNDIRLTYDYCANDLSDEIVGMWVCSESLPGVENAVAIISYSEEGKMTMTTQASDFIADDFVKQESEYKVIGDLIFRILPTEIVPEGIPPYIVSRLIYTPNANALGDILTENQYVYSNNGLVEKTTSFLRVKQHLDLPGNKYDYRATYISNVKGEDKDIPFMNTSFNFAKMDGSIIDKFLKATLFAVEFPDANTLKYNFLLGGEISPMRAPIEVEDNKMTIKMSVTNPAYQDVVVYAFQDQDNTQMHLYMPTSSFEKFFANASVHMMLSNGQLNENDTEAIANEFKKIADAVESINLSLVMTKAK